MQIFRTVRLVVLLAALAAVLAPSASASPATVKHEAAVVRLVNQIRAANGLAPVRSTPGLVAAARSHSGDMGGRAYFSHLTLGAGTSYAARIRQFDHTTKRWMGETIAWGVGAPGTAAGVVAAWMASPPHRVALLDSRFNRIGVGTWQGSFQGMAGARVVTADLAG